MSKWDKWLLEYSYLHPCDAREIYWHLIHLNYVVYWDLGSKIKACPMKGKR